MRLYHGTTPDRAKIIRAKGFKDRVGSYGIHRVTSDGSVPRMRRGVWLADRCLDANHGLPTDFPQDQDYIYFKFDIPAKLIRQYEVPEECKSYREWCIPAQIVNKYFTGATTTRQCGFPKIVIPPAVLKRMWRESKRIAARIKIAQESP